MRTRLSAARVALVVCGVLAAPAAGAQPAFGFAEAEDWTLAVSVARANPAIHGDLSLGEDLGATPIDVDDMLDLDSSDTWAGRAELRLGDHHLRFEYLPVRYEGDSLLPAPALAFGIPFSAGDRIVSELGIRRYQLSYRYDFHVGEHVTLAPMVAISFLDTWIDLDNRSIPGMRFEDEVRAPVPVGGLRIGVRPLPRLELFGEARGMRAGEIADFSDIRLWSGEVGLAILLSPHIALRARYAVDDARVTISDVEVDLRQDGPSLELELRF